MDQQITNQVNTLINQVDDTLDTALEKLREGLNETVITKLVKEKESLRTDVAKLLVENAKLQKEKMESQKVQDELKKYGNIKDLEAKWNEVKELKAKLDLQFDKLKLEQEELTKAKLKFEEEKKTFEKGKLESDLAKSGLGGNFMDFVAQEKTSEKTNEFDPVLMKELTLQLIRSKPLELKKVPEKERTLELCKVAVKGNINALEFVPQDHLMKVYDFLFETYDHVIGYVPLHLTTQELCDRAIEYDVNNFRKIPVQFRSQNMCNVVQVLYSEYKYQNDQDSFLANVPKQFLTKEMCETIVGLNGKELFGVPNEWKTLELCKKAYQNIRYAINHVPDPLKNSIYA